MTMVTIMQQISAGEFKAKCLQLMDEVKETHTAILITKRGIPVAKLVPVEESKPVELFGYLQGTVSFNADIVQPLGEHWDAENE